MGTSRYAHCRDCGHADFAVMQGGGFAFDLKRCDQCGETKSVPSIAANRNIPWTLRRDAEPAPRAGWLERLFQRQTAFSVGDSVTVMVGTFARLPATVRRVDNKRRKLHVVVSFFGRERPLDLGFHQVRYGHTPVSSTENPKVVTPAKCECGGSFTGDAPPRCPSCRSTSIELGRIRNYYD